MALVLTIGGVLRTSVLVEGSLSVEQQAADFISVCSLVLLDKDGNITIEAEDSISVVDGATTFFAGRVVDIRYSLFTTQGRYITVRCQDLNAQPGETVIDDTEVFAALADSAIINALFDEYLPAVDSETYVATIQDPLTITFEPTTLQSALSQICTRTGGYFYIDFDNKLHYFSAEAEGVAWWLSDDPDQIDSFSYFSTDVDKTALATTRLDGVFVIGDGVEGWRGSHAPGDRQGIARDNRITTATGVNQRGDAILSRYGDPQVTYTVSTYKAGLRAGMDIRFICGLYGVDDTFTVRRMVVKWDKAGIAYYTLTLGDVVNPSLINERNWTDTLPQTLGPITAPRLPTSSKGWSHDLVFSATDHDTVAWTSGIIYLADGTTYAIIAGNTGNIAVTTYIFLDLDSSETVLQTTPNASVAVGTRKILIAWAKNEAAGLSTTFFVFGGSGQNVIVDTAQIVAGAITSTKVGALAIETPALAAGAVTAAKIAALTIEAGNIKANTITAGQIAAGTITTNEIAANTVMAGNIASGAIQTDELAAGAVTAVKIAANTITADKIAMGMGDNLFNAADGLLLLGPYCKISPTEWWSLRKQKATLSGAFHQEAGRWQGTRGLVIEEATTNRIKNPSIEVDTTNWGAISSTISRDTTCTVFGKASLKVVTNNAVANEGVWAVVTAETSASTQYTFSCYLRGAGTVMLRFWDSVGGHQSSGTITLTDTWKRYGFTATFGTGVDRNVYIRTIGQQAATFYCDGFQLEALAVATSYADGSLGTGYAWTGTAHNSTSTRAVTEVNLDAHGKLLENNATMSFRIVTQAAYAYDGTWPTATPLLMDIYEDASNRIFIAFSSATDKLYASVVSGGTTLTLTPSAVTPFSAGDWLDIILTIDFTGNKYYFYFNGGEIASGTTDLANIVTLSQWNVASRFNAVSQAGWNVAEFAAFGRVLTASEVAAMYALQRPTVDVGSLDKPGIFILDGQFRILSSQTGNRIEITPEEVAGYDSAGTKQFYLQASDGKAVAGAGAVVLDAGGITLTAVNADTSRIKWGTGFANISAYQSGVLRYLWLKVPAGASGETTMINLETVGLDAHDDALLSVQGESDTDPARIYALVGGKYNIVVFVDYVQIGQGITERTEFGGPIVVGKAAGDYGGSGISDGMLWYNTTTNKLRLRAAGAWVSLN